VEAGQMSGRQWRRKQGTRNIIFGGVLLHVQSSVFMDEKLGSLGRRIGSTSLVSTGSRLQKAEEE